jgi:FkbM family methyltransferase
MENNNFYYNANYYHFKYYKDDESGIGCINEIVQNNEYKLSNFNNCVDKHFIDIGANCGVATIILAKQNPQSFVYSFEPDRRVFELLKENVKINELSNVKIFNLAVSKKEIDKIQLCICPLYSGGNTTYSNTSEMMKFYGRSVDYYDVDCTYLDKIVLDNNINEVELLKIDCEGAEFDILYHSETIKNRQIRNIVGEFHDLRYNILNNNQYTSIHLIEYCKKYIEGLFEVKILEI